MSELKPPPVPPRPADLTREIYNLVLEIHHGWQPLVTDVLRLHGRMDSAEEAIVVLRRRALSEPPPHYKRTGSGSYIVPTEDELNALILRHNNAQDAGTWRTVKGKALAAVVGGVVLILLGLLGGVLVGQAGKPPPPMVLPR